MILDNSRSAKDYISEAYSQELAAIQAKAKLLETPASIIEREQTEKTFQMTEAILGRQILSDEVTGEYSELLAMIEAKKQELKKLYGIDIEDGALQAVKNAAKSVSDQFTQELQQKKEAFEETMKQSADDLKTQMDAKNAETEEKVEEIRQKTKKLQEDATQEAKREKEQYDYDLARSRKQAKEERERIVADRKKALQLKEQEAQEAKQACIDKLAEIEKMQATVDDIPRELGAAKAQGAADKEKELNKEYGYHKWMADKENQTRINELQDEFNDLQKKYQELCKEKAALSAALEDCNAQSRQLTSDTVKSIGGINILNTDNHPYNSAGKK